jgi:hypothetical protein
VPCDTNDGDLLWEDLKASHFTTTVGKEEGTGAFETHVCRPHFGISAFLDYVGNSWLWGGRHVGVRLLVIIFSMNVENARRLK